MSTVRPTGRIFISYRRSDAEAPAGRISDRLTARFGDSQVFMDVDAIEPGLRFRQVIEEAIGSCDVLLAVIGPTWLAASDAAGDRRLDNPNDLVRLEIEAALAREVRVIPVLVGEAGMPHARDLPSSLAPLADLNAARLRHAAFTDDVTRLSDVIERVLAESISQRSSGESADRTAASVDAGSPPIVPRPPVTRARTPGGPDTPARRRSGTRVALVALLALVAAATATFTVIRLTGAGGDTSAGPDSEVAASSRGGAGLPPSTSPLEYASASIDQPADGASVTANAQVSGTAALAADVALWVVLEPPDGSIHFVSRRPVSVDGAGQWSTKASVGQGSDDAGNRYTIHAVATLRSGSVFQSFLQQGGEGGFPEMPADVKVLDSATVILS